MKDESTAETLLTVRDVAQRLNVPVTWVYSAHEDGRLPMIKIGKYVRISPLALERWIAAERQRGEELAQQRRDAARDAAAGLSC